MAAKLLTHVVGPWPMNSYTIICDETQSSAIIDPGAEAPALLTAVAGTTVKAILLTHGHPDHVSALVEVQVTTRAPVYLHPAEAEKFEMQYDIPLSNGMFIPIGNLLVRAIHTPGHTPGMTCFDLGDGRILVGDTLFTGGPGRTWSPEDFATTMRTMQEVVFTWPDENEFYPGHGPSGTIGQERPAFEAFVERGWPADLQGDVTWQAAA